MEHVVQSKQTKAMWTLAGHKFHNFSFMGSLKSANDIAGSTSNLPKALVFVSTTSQTMFIVVKLLS